MIEAKPNDFVGHRSAVRPFGRSAERCRTVWPRRIRNPRYTSVFCRSAKWNGALKERLKVSFRVSVRSTLFPRGPRWNAQNHFPIAFGSRVCFSMRLIRQSLVNRPYRPRNPARDSAVVASLALQRGVPPETIRRALTRNGDGSASGALGTLLDMLASKRGP
jgi:hypothetical protein